MQQCSEDLSDIILADSNIIIQLLFLHHKMILILKELRKDIPFRILEMHMSFSREKLYVWNLGCHAF